MWRLRSFKTWQWIYSFFVLDKYECQGFFSDHFMRGGTLFSKFICWLNNLTHPLNMALKCLSGCPILFLTHGYDQTPLVSKITKKIGIWWGGDPPCPLHLGKPWYVKLFIPVLLSQWCYCYCNSNLTIHNKKQNQYHIFFFFIYQSKE